MFGFVFLDYCYDDRLEEEFLRSQYRKVIAFTPLRLSPIMRSRSTLPDTRGGRTPGPSLILGILAGMHAFVDGGRCRLLQLERAS